jgi:hypothetical protein
MTQPSTNRLACASPTLVESEAIVRAFSPGSTLGAGTKGLSSTWPEMLVGDTHPLVPVRITNRD